jgi:hypothetical protein
MLNSRMYRTVIHGHFILPAHVMHVLDLLSRFMKLDVESQTTICESVGLGIEAAHDLCNRILAVT